MYIRWKTRPERRVVPIGDGKQWEDDPRHSAFLVENRRIDGQPRQHIVAYLGSVRDHELREDDCWYPVGLYWFWDGALKQLQALDLPEAELTRHIDKLNERVPRLRDEWLAAWRKNPETLGEKPPRGRSESELLATR